MDLPVPHLARRRLIGALALSPFAALLPAAAAEASGGSGSSGIPAGFGSVDPRTARRVPLWQELSPATPIFPGDPVFTYDIAATIPADGYLVERITSLGTHTGTHISAPAHFIEGGRFLDQIGERFTLMPLVVIDVRARVAAEGGDFSLDVADVRKWEKKIGAIPSGGCVLLLSGFGERFTQESYFDPAPGFTGEATAWLFDKRGIVGIGSDTFGPDASSDGDYASTTTALDRGGITVENVGAGLKKMRAHGDWVAINGARPHFGGFEMGITGFTRC